MFQNAAPDNDWKGSTVIHSRWVLTTQPSVTHTHIVDAANVDTTKAQNESARVYGSLVIWYCIVEPITILGLLGNGSVFWFLCCRIKRTKYTVYVLNLSVADFTILICYNFWFLSQFITWIDQTSEAYPLVVDILAIFGYNTSFFLLTAISVERCLGAFFPLWYHFSRPEHLSAILCALLWVLSCAATAVEYLTTWQVLLRDEVPCEGYMVTCIFLTTLCLIFIPAMVFCSISLFIKMQRKSQPVSSARLYISIVTTVVLFLILAVPFRIINLIDYWHPITQLEWALLHFSFFLHTINSSLNPFVYFLVGRHKQQRSHKSLYGALYRSCKDEPEVMPEEHLGNEQIG